MGNSEPASPEGCAGSQTRFAWPSSRGARGSCGHCSLGGDKGTQPAGQDSQPCWLGLGVAPTQQNQGNGNATDGIRHLATAYCALLGGEQREGTSQQVSFPNFPSESLEQLGLGV